MISLGALIMSECLFQALLSLAVVLELVIIWRGLCDRRAILMPVFAGCLLGAAPLVRPNGLIMVGLTPIPWDRRLAVRAGNPWRYRSRMGGKEQDPGGAVDFQHGRCFYRPAGILQYRNGKPSVTIQQKARWRSSRFLSTTIPI